MWNVIWVTAEAEKLERALKRFDEMSILTKVRTFLDDNRCFFEILVPAAETGLALDALVEM